MIIYHTNKWYDVLNQKDKAITAALIDKLFKNLEGILNNTQIFILTQWCR